MFNLSNSELDKIISLMKSELKDKYMQDIDINQIAKKISIAINKYEHDFSILESVVSEMLSLLIEEQYNLDENAKRIFNLINEKGIKYDRENERFYLDESFFEDIIDNISENKKIEENRIRFRLDEFYKYRIIPVYLTIDIESFYDSYNKGKYNLEPEFQRFQVWSNNKRSALIESIFLSIPIPSIYSYEIKNNRYEIVDGKQRLLTIIDFIENKFSLDKKRDLIELNGKRYADLTDDQKEIFKSYSLNFMRIPLSNNNNENLKYIIFDRLNSNSMVLNFQELRNSMYRSELNDEVKDYALNNTKYNSFFPSEKFKRMQNIEMIYRFLSLKDKVVFSRDLIKLKEHSGIKESIDKYMKMWAKIFDKKKASSELNIFDKVLNKTTAIFGENSFKSFNANEFIWKKAINRPLMDAEMLVIYLADKNEILKIDKLVSYSKEIIEDLAEEFTVNDEFRDSFLSATGNSKSIEIKLNTVFKILKKYG